MINLKRLRINKAGAYVCIDGYYLFAIGSRTNNGHIPVVRLGGHRERDETGWQCAVREVYEESNVQITPLLPSVSYVSDRDHTEAELQEIEWQTSLGHEPIPMLTIIYQRKDNMHLSLMYLAQADGVPKPSSEVKGLLLLTKEEIHRLCRKPMTLEQYLRGGGKAILHAKFDTSLVLEPFVQLRLLSRILSLESGHTTQGRLT